MIRLLIITLATAAMLALPRAAAAQEQDPDSLARAVARLEAKIDSLEQVIRQLLARGADAAQEQDELEALRRAAREEARAGMADAPDEDAQSRTSNLNILNPEISITGDFVGSFVAPNGESNNVAATPREFEFSFQSALDPYTRTKVFITHEEDFEIAGFPEEEEEEEAGGFEIEEGYLYWVGLPGGFGAKLGKFRQDIGLYNRWHTHALLEVERPLASQIFLGEDGLIQTGASVTLPAFTFGPATQTLLVEVTTASNDALFAGSNELSYLGRFQTFWDLGRSYLQLGATGVYGENDDEALETRLLGLDASFRWTPGNARYRDLQLKGEWFFVEQDRPGDEARGDGGYLQANMRLNRRWTLGARADFLNGFGAEPEVFQLTPSITFWQSEFVRLRLQYNFLRPEGGAGNHTLLLQTVWAVGPHKHETY